MSKYELINDLCESKVFRSQAALNKFSKQQKAEYFYAVLLGTIALALDTKTTSWAREYASKTAAFNNFDYFRPSGTDLYVLTYAANKEIGLSYLLTRKLLEIYRGLGRGNVSSALIRQSLLRIERALNISDSRLRAVRRTVTNWLDSGEAGRKSAIMNLIRVINQYSRLTEILPYLKTLTKGEPGRFGKASTLKKAAAVAGIGLAGLVYGYATHDPNKRTRITKSLMKNSIELGDDVLAEDRGTQLFAIAKGLGEHPSVERVLRVNYINDGISAFVRTTDGNAYEFEIRPARFAKGHEGVRGVTESTDNLLAKFGIREISDVIEVHNVGWGEEDPAYMYAVVAPGYGQSGYFSDYDEAREHAKEAFPFLKDDYAESVEEDLWEYVITELAPFEDDEFEDLFV